MSGPTVEPLEAGRLVADRYEVLRALDEPAGTWRYEAVARSGAGAPVLGGERVWLHLLGTAPDPAVVRRIERGAKALRGSRDGHLVDVIDVVEQEGLCFAVSEPLAAPSLAQLLRERGALPTAAAVESALQICGALEAARQVGVEGRAVGAADVFVLGVSLDGSDGAASERDRPDSRVLPHRLLDEGAAGAASDDQAGLVGVVGQLFWAMLAGEWRAPAKGNGNTSRGDLRSLRALRAIWDVEPLTTEVEEIVAALTADPVERSAASLEAVAARLRAVTGALVDQARSSPLATAADASSSDALAADAEGPPTDLDPRSVDVDDEGELGREVPPATAQPVETAASPGRERAGQAADEAAEPALARGVDPTAQAAVGTTMKSHRDAALELPAAERPTVEVREAAPASAPTRGVRAARLASSARPRAWDDESRERSLWAIAAVVAGVLAIALGIALGVR